VESLKDHPIETWQGEITPDQMRRFADTARIPVSPLWAIAVETAERAAEAWKTPEHANALEEDLKDSIGRQILGVAARVQVTEGRTCVAWLRPKDSSPLALAAPEFSASPREAGTI
jgi:hypothetical protein